MPHRSFVNHIETTVISENIYCYLGFIRVPFRVLCFENDLVFSSNRSAESVVNLIGYLFAIYFPRIDFRVN